MTSAAVGARPARCRAGEAPARRIRQRSGRLRRNGGRLNFSAPPDLSRAHGRVRPIPRNHRRRPAARFVPARGRQRRPSTRFTRAMRRSRVPRGMILASMGKASRAGEPQAEERELGGADGHCRRHRTAGASRRRRSHLARCEDGGGRPGRSHQCRRHSAVEELCLSGSFDELIVVPLPDYPGPHDVMHLMSLVSPVDRDLAVVYSRLLPDAFRQTLLRSWVSARRGAGRRVRHDGM